MTALAVLEQARAAGVRLSATPEGTIRLRSSAPLPDGLREALILHKRELLGLLAGDSAPSRRPAGPAAPKAAAPLAQSLTVDEAELFHERLAIATVDGRLSEEEAVHLAWEQIQAQRRANGIAEG